MSTCSLTLSELIAKITPCRSIEIVIYDIKTSKIRERFYVPIEAVEKCLELGAEALVRVLTHSIVQVPGEDRFEFHFHMPEDMKSFRGEKYAYGEL